ncbi:MAG TPA: MarC family protein [Rhizomicrobium sp.]|nr:MarC family protein [Rhizomicrobium sp.]
MFGPAEIFTLLFVTLGPLKILGPFMQCTREVTAPTLRRIALWAFTIATMSIVVGALLGTALMENWHVSLPALTLSAGIIFFLVALRQLMAQYQPPEPLVTSETLPQAPVVAASRLVFPIVLTPYGVAVVIALLARSDSSERTGTILAILLGIMVIDLAAMWFVRRILTGFIPLVLQVVGAVLAVLQVALSVEFILLGLRALHAVS